MPGRSECLTSPIWLLLVSHQPQGGEPTHLSNCLELTSLSQAALSSCGAISSSLRVKNRIVVSLAEEAIYDAGPAEPAIIADDQMELDE